MAVFEPTRLYGRYFTVYGAGLYLRERWPPGISGTHIRAACRSGAVAGAVLVEYRAGRYIYLLPVEALVVWWEAKLARRRERKKGGVR